MRVSPKDKVREALAHVETSEVEAARIVDSAPNVNWPTASRLFRLSPLVEAHLQAASLRRG